MNFKSFIFERNDKIQIEVVLNIAKEILDKLEKHYSGLFNMYFPNKKTIDTHEKFITWRSKCRNYEDNVPQYAGRRFFILSDKGNLHGEYFKDKIYIYDKEFSQLLSDLKNLHHSFEYNLRGEYKISAKNFKIKREAKVFYEKMMQRFKNKKEDYLRVLFHEITHLFDHDRLGDKFDLINKINDKKLNSKVKYNQFQDPFVNPKNKIIYNTIYTNSDIETNAWFLTQAHQILEKQFNNFQDLLKDFVSSFESNWSFLSEDKKRKMINRLYQIWNTK